MIPALLLVLLAALLGILAGIVTGLTPGVHINLVSAMLFAAAPALLAFFPLLALCCFIVSMSVTHTFLDAIPSIFLGAPESGEDALGVLPGHRYLLKGWGMMALKLTIVGALAASVISVALFPAFLVLSKLLYPLLKPVMGWLLLALALYMVLRDRLRLWAGLIFVLSGVLGVVVLNMPTIANPLFPLLSGLFGIATLLVSLNESTSIPPQSTSDPEIKLRGVAWKALASGQASGFLTVLFPGLSGAIAALLSLQVSRDLGDHGYMLLSGSIGTANMVLSLATLYAIDKARNGSIATVQQLLSSVTLAHILVFLAVVLVAAGAGAILALYFGKGFARLLSIMPYRALVIGIIVFIVVLTPLLAGWTGLLILVTSTAVGLLPAVVKTARVHAMGCLLVPVILFFLA